MSRKTAKSAPAERSNTVGVIGLGRMGAPMARHLAGRGYRVIGYDTGKITGEAANCLAILAPDAAAVGRAAFLTLIIVPDDDDVQSICLGPNGLFSAAMAGGIVGICSSVRPETVRDLEEPARRAGAEVLDMPLTKGVRAAVDGTMTILVGGDAAVLERAMPALDSFATAVHRVGDLGAGQIAKTVNNIMLWSTMVSLAEALRLGAAFGVSPTALREALGDCSADSWVLREIGRIQPTWPQKDMDIARNLAKQENLTLPVLDQVAQSVMDYDRPTLDRILATE